MKAELSDERPDIGSSFRFESASRMTGRLKTLERKRLEPTNWVVKLQIFMFIRDFGEKWSKFDFRIFFKMGWNSRSKVEMIFLFTVTGDFFSVNHVGFFAIWWPTWFLVDQHNFLCLYGEVPLCINPWNINVFSCGCEFWFGKFFTCKFCPHILILVVRWNLLWGFSLPFAEAFCHLVVFFLSPFGRLTWNLQTNKSDTCNPNDSNDPFVLNGRDFGPSFGGL